ncbi:3727_t:CDS:2 [Cetraspora pellucida]|uniref:3727_t:CDS:1 n=1 Tax=Cetraspora pellucida TaxID=1433469 RepID=A0ACA9NEF0_9GLOM|nr:3727_t:CDS:2 [Cetraspora pellucida]
MSIIKFSKNNNQLEINGNWIDPISVDKVSAPKLHEKGVLVFSALGYLFTIDKENQLLGISGGRIEEPKESEEIIKFTCHEQKLKDNELADNETKDLIREWSVKYLACYSKVTKEKMNGLNCQTCKKDISKEEHYITRRQNLNKLEKFMGETKHYLTVDYC